MATEEAIVEFAKENGLVIMPYRDLKAFVEEINKNDGHCFCTRTCPCVESLADIQEATTPDMQSCRCNLLCTPAYIEAWRKEWEKAGITVPTSTSTPTASKSKAKATAKKETSTPKSPAGAKRQPVRSDQIKMPELREAVRTLEGVEKLLKIIPDDGKKLLANIDEAEAMIKKNIPEHECEVCAGYMESMRRNVVFLRKECELNSIGCAEVNEGVIDRIEKMKEVFAGVDKMQSGETVETEPETKPVKNETTKPDTGFRDSFHACTSSTIKGELQDVPREDRICVASKMCRKDALSKLKAMTECTNGKEGTT